MPRHVFHLIPHTHWDREWYLSRSAFRVRLVAALSDLLDLLDREPEARFTLDGQTVLVEDALEVEPSWEQRVARHVREGRLDVGPWYILADEQIPAGEPLLRNLLLGTSQARRLGRRMDVCYSPDAFGHPASLPMVAHQARISSGVAWRGVAIPGGGDLAWWSGPDGRAMLIHLLPSQGYEIGAVLGTGGRALRAAWKALRELLIERSASREIAVFVGADHHAPPPSLVRLRDRLRRLEPTAEVRLSTLSEYFRAVWREAGVLPEISGEQRSPTPGTWVLQGTHGTRSRQKRWYSRAELALGRHAEPLVALAIAGRAAPPGATALLRLNWKSLIACQFHDTLCGTVSDPVAAEQVQRLQAVADGSRELIRSVSHAILGHDPDRVRESPDTARPTLVLWNPTARRRREITIADLTLFREDLPVGPPDGRLPRRAKVPDDFALRASDGRIHPVQVIRRQPAIERLDAARHYPDQDLVERVTVAFRSPEVEGFGFAGLRPVTRRATPARRGLAVANRALANALVSVRLAPDGTVTLHDLRSDERYRRLLSLEDAVDAGDSYSVFIPPRSSTKRKIRHLATHVLAEGPLVGVVESRLELESAAAGVLAIRRTITLRADSPLIQVRLEVLNRSQGHRLRVGFPTGVGGGALSGTGFGHVSRGPGVEVASRDGGETSVATAPAHRYVAVGEGKRGLAVLLPGFFEHQWTVRGDLWCTLLRSIGDLARSDLPTRPGAAGWHADIPEAQEQGWHRIELAVVPLNRDAHHRPWELEAAWEDAFLPVGGRFLRDFSGRVPDGGVRLIGEGLILSALKPSEDGRAVILRCWNSREVAVQGRVRFDRAPMMVRCCDATEEGGVPLRVRRGRQVEFEVAPRELFSIRMEYER